MIDAKIEATLNAIGVPVSRVFNRLKHTTYIFWQYITSLPNNYTDDDYETIDHTLRVHIFAKQNYSAMLGDTINALKIAGFTIASIDSEIYEEETGYFHRPITIQFMEEITICN